MMRKFKYNKLIRDKIAQRMQKTGANPIVKYLNETAYKNQLLVKLLEEIKELKARLEQKNVGLEELADVYELLECLLKALNIKKSDLQKEKARKNKCSGSFKKGIYVTEVSVPDDDKYLNHYLDNPKKYPEIK